MRANGIATLFCHEVRILRAGTAADRYGNQTKNWMTTRRRTSRARVVQQARNEVGDGREGRTTDWICYLPAGTDVTALDRIQWGTETFEVIGRPNRAPDRWGEHHIELDLRIVEG